MFAVGSYQSTYTGPFQASGETMRRQRNDAYAMGAASGDRRAYLNPNKGVGVGSKAMQYRAGLAGDSAAARQFGAGQQSLLENLTTNADSRFTYQNNQADELNMLRGLQLQREGADQNFRLTARGDEIDKNMTLRKMRAERDVANSQNNLALLSALLGAV